ncbi:HNH endonuclease [Rhizobium sp. GN54]|uniref:HNH endonuclease n=1 Tax=Rhizobium sp. GN54 TaxID=2898150 RepID=UPI001E34E12F|nr:HNH endonuclease [Rhizobium sp. GN54]MCD2182236.1 HNH endonuclease [Rhizobium sp. GN54]
MKRRASKLEVPPLCIYCSESNPEFFQGVEHVVPQAFGKFSDQTPTLVGAVCDDCNKHFANNGDLLLGRGSIHGVRRLRYGQTTTRKYPDRRLHTVFPDDPALGPLRGALASLRMIDRVIEPPALQLRILNLQTGRTEFYLRHDLDKLHYDPTIYGVPAGDEPATMQVRIDFANSREELEDFTELVRLRGVPYRSGPIESYKVGPAPYVDVEHEETIDDAYLQALAKILVNFAAKYLSVQEVLQQRWSAARDFVRWGKGELSFRLVESRECNIPGREPRWPGIIISLWNDPKGVIGSIKFYDGAQYDLLLIVGQSLRDDQLITYEFIDGRLPINLAE